jgi:hypothetical protein
MGPPPGRGRCGYGKSPLSYFQWTALTPLPAGPSKLSDHTVFHPLGRRRGQGLRFRAEVACGSGPPDEQPSRLAVSKTAAPASSRGVPLKAPNGRAYWYEPVRSRDDYVTQLLNEALSVAPDPAATLVRLVAGMQPAEIASLRAALDAATSKETPN